MKTTAIVLAAGEGTRMKSNHAKVSHEILGKPMIQWVVDAARAAGCDRIVAVVGSHADEVRALLSHYDNVECVEQTERLGTGHAVKVVLENTEIPDGPVCILNGDLPLIEPATITKFAESVSDGITKGAILTMTPPDPFGYGRIQLDEKGHFVRIIEQKDCTEEEAQTLLECNAGCYAFDGAALKEHISELSANNAQQEFYLTDMLEILRQANKKVSIFHCDDYREGLGVNSRVQLAELTAIARDTINKRHMLAGVTMIDPTSTWIGPDVVIGKDSTLLPSCMLLGTTHLGEGCVVGPNTRLTNTTAGNFCTIDETVAIDAVLENNVTCGPRAYLRPGTHMLDYSKAGTHVEIKKSTIGQHSKVPHLSYIGDTTMGEGVNVGAGSITCNYDGKNKHATHIGNHSFIGSDTMMVAPVNIGESCVIGAGSVITHDVPDGALALERNHQTIIEGYTSKKQAATKE